VGRKKGEEKSESRKDCCCWWWYSVVVVVVVVVWCGVLVVWFVVGVENKHLGSITTQVA